MKIDRLIGIVVYLLNNGKTSAQKLAEEFEVSSRTIVRDLEALDLAGIPIQSFYGVNGGYQIMDGYVWEKQVTTNHEYDLIITALKGLTSAYTNKKLEQTLRKIKNLNNAEAGTVSVDFSVAREDAEINKQLMLLEDAIEKKCVVRFSYTNSYDEVKEIQVEPVCLQYKWYNWYLIGFHEKYQEYCMFKLVRMEHLEITDIPNAKTHNPAEIELKSNSAHMVHIRLYGKASIKSKCREYLNGQITQEFENGDFEFCFSVPAHETFWYGVILSFGNKVRIVEPQEVKERIVNTCKEIQKEYEE